MIFTISCCITCFIIGAVFGVHAEQQLMRRLMLASKNANDFLRASFLHLTGTPFKE